MFKVAMSKVALLALLSASGTLTFAESKISQTFQVRLDDPLTSYGSPVGTSFTATVISPLEVKGQIVIPQGSLVHGTVKRASAVGFGLGHERASLELGFDEYALAGGERYPLGARLAFIENAREQVDTRGRIKGILAAATPQGFLRGIWYRPSASFFHRSALGLTGLGGALWSHYSLGPAGAAGLLAARYFAFPLPEPEIQLPPGTEMRLLATGVPEDAPTTPVPDETPVEESTFAVWLQAHSRAVTRPDGKPADDVINLAFLGTADELQNAFSAAGWLPAEPKTMHTLSATYRAYNSMTGYSTAPVSTLLYQQEAPSVVFQKSFNTIAKRHHIRIWSAGVFEGSEVWLGAATHDADIGFRFASMTVTHKIDLRTDGERKKVITDLSFAACSKQVSYLDRSEDVASARSKGIQTDGRMAVIWLQPCSDTPASTDLVTQDAARIQAPGSRPKRLARRFVLETRQYFLRDNMYYWAYRAAVMARRNSLPEVLPVE